MDGILKFCIAWWSKKLYNKVNLREEKRDEQRAPSNGRDFGNHPRIKERVRNSAVSSPNIKGKNKFPGSACVRGTRRSHGCEVGETGRETVERNWDFIMWRAVRHTFERG